MQAVDAHLSDHVVSHGVLLWSGQQGGLRRDLGLWLLRRAGEKASARLGGCRWGTHIRTD